MRLLVLTDKYYPKPYANAICAQELIRVWKEQGHIVDVLAYEDFNGNPSVWEENQIYYVHPDIRLRFYYYADFVRKTQKGKISKIIANVISKSWGLVVLPWQPFFSFSFPKRIYRKMEELEKKNGYDGIIAIFQPLDTNIAAYKFKKKHPEIPYIVFCVDHIKKAFVQKYFGEKFADGYFWEKRMMENCEAYFFMHSRKEDYNLARYATYQDKLYETDLPRFKLKEYEIPLYDFGEKAEHWVYAGSIGGIDYEPYEMLQIFQKISKNQNRILHLFIRGAEADKIEKMAKKEQWNVKVHGYVDATTLESVMATADVIVSLKTSNQISAKIFECMSYGKTIVHFSGCENDPNVAYLQKYKLGKIVKMYEDEVLQIQKLEEFLQNHTSERANMDEIRKIFEMSTPEYSANKILQCISMVNK